MRVILNILWLVLCGFWMALGYLFAALLMFILIITIPFALQAVKLAIFALWQFGRTLVKRPDAGAPSVVGNVLWSHRVIGHHRAPNRRTRRTPYQPALAKDAVLQGL